MPRIDHHRTPYDEGTLTKLALFELYLTEWLPVFLSHKGITSLNIYDFFCGPGIDLAGQKGSPLRAMEVIGKYKHIIEQSKKSIHLIFYDKDIEKVKYLKQIFNQDVCHIKNVSISINPCDFEDAFAKEHNRIKNDNAANFLFIDPSGLIPINILKDIVKIDYTDFLLFTPTSHVSRFGEEESFQKCLPGFKKESITDYSKSQNCICEYYKNIVVGHSQYFMAPFSIKNEKNKINGLIFGSKSIRGLQKFIQACWKIDKDNGEANFGLKGDLPDTGQLLLDQNLGKTKKWRNFEEYVKNIVFSKKATSNKELYHSVLLKGFLGRHAKKVLSELKNKNFINKVPPMSYKSVIQLNKIEMIEVLG